MDRLARRKTHTDREKEITKLQKRYEVVLKAYKDSVQWIPLEKPERDGWERTYVLRDDIAASPMAKFYANLLPLINSVQLSRRKDFTYRPYKRSRKGRSRRQKRRPLPQPLILLSKSYLNGMNPKEQSHFELVKDDTSVSWWKRNRVVMNKPWVYKQVIQPHFVTHVRTDDKELDTELDRISDKLYSRASPLYSYHEWNRSDPWYDADEERRRTLEKRTILLEASDEYQAAQDERDLLFSESVDIEWDSTWDLDWE